MASAAKFTWRITNFSDRKSERRRCSDVFNVGGCIWRIVVYPAGNGVDYLSMYLEVDKEQEGLPSEWSIDAKFSFTLVNHLRDYHSIKKESRYEFTAEDNNWGWKSFKKLTELYGISKGYLFDNTDLVVEAEIEVLNVSPPSTVVFETFLSNLDKFITDAAQGRNSAGSSNDGLKSEVPSLEEVEIAKQSLEECLSDISKLNITNRLAKSLETLSRAEIGLSYKEQRAVELFWGEFDDFIADFLDFEQENTEFELHKLARDQMFHSIKKDQKYHHSNKKRLDELTKDEEEYKERMEEAKSSKDKPNLNLGVVDERIGEKKIRVQGPREQTRTS